MVIVNASKRLTTHRSDMLTSLLWLMSLGAMKEGLNLWCVTELSQF